MCSHRMHLKTFALLDGRAGPGRVAGAYTMYALVSQKRLYNVHRNNIVYLVARFNCFALTKMRMVYDQTKPYIQLAKVFANMIPFFLLFFTSFVDINILCSLTSTGRAQLNECVNINDVDVDFC